MYMKLNRPKHITLKKSAKPPGPYSPKGGSSSYVSHLLNSDPKAQITTYSHTSKITATANKKGGLFSMQHSTHKMPSQRTYLKRVRNSNVIHKTNLNIHPGKAAGMIAGAAAVAGGGYMAYTHRSQIKSGMHNARMRSSNIVHAATGKSVLGKSARTNAAKSNSRVSIMHQRRH